jgi:hypothetical protein
LRKPACVETMMMQVLGILSYEGVGFLYFSVVLHSFLLHSVECAEFPFSIEFCGRI